MKLEIPEVVFQSYAFFSGILVVKMLFMSLLTARHRIGKKIFANPEDASWDKKAKVVYDDPDVERVRRAHRNDLENILPFFVVGLLYCFTHPDPATAKLLFQIYTGARIAHTVSYAVIPLPQPSRGLAFFAGLAVTVYMSVKVIMFFA